MIQRLLEDQLQQAITRIPSVALVGPRQVGKTTLKNKIKNINQND